MHKMCIIPYWGHLRYHLLSTIILLKMLNLNSLSLKLYIMICNSKVTTSALFIHYKHITVQTNVENLVDFNKLDSNNIDLYY